MEKVIVKLRDKKSCFFDQKNNIFISKPDAVEVLKTRKIAEGLRYGALIQVNEEELKDVKKEDPVPEEDESDKEKAAKKAYDLLQSLAEDKPDFNATDYEVLKEWVGILKLTPASKKKEDYIAALNEAVEYFKEDFMDE